MDGDQNSDTQSSMEIVLDKLSSMESRMEDTFSNLHVQITAPNSEFKEELNGMKVRSKSSKNRSTAPGLLSKIYRQKPKH